VEESTNLMDGEWEAERELDSELWKMECWWKCKNASMQ